jgi:hypothetical protein
MRYIAPASRVAGMQRWRVWSAFVISLAAVPVAASAADCDENDPNGPVRSGQVTLTASDLIDEARAELRTFVVTGSLGKVEAAIVAATPPAIANGVTAVPRLSRLSPGYGEQLKGIVVVAPLKGADRSVRIVVRLRQVCAQYFRDSFLSQ